MDKETEERVNRPIPFQEYPKMLHHPDGRTLVVENDREASAAGGEWMPNPTEALKVKAQRDEAAEKREAVQTFKDFAEDDKATKGRKG